MGGNQSEPSNIGMPKGSGYRVLALEAGSPVDKKLDIFFDFIIDAIPNREPERNPK